MNLYKIYTRQNQKYIFIGLFYIMSISGIINFFVSLFVFFIVLIIIFIYRNEIKGLFEYIISGISSLLNITYSNSSELLFFFGLLLFGVLIVKIKDGLGGFETFISKLTYINRLNYKDKEELMESEHFNKYIDSVHMNMYAVKVPNYKNNFKKEYGDMLAVVPDEYLDTLDKEVEIASDLISKSDIKVLDDKDWNMLVSRKGLEMDMPFTLDKFIIIPIDTLQFYNAKYMVKNKPNKKGDKNFYNAFTKTLIHEKIHVLQRKYQDKFNEFYKKEYKFVDVYPKQSYDIPEELRKVYMTNPDSNFDVWTYKYNSNKYLPLITVTNGLLTEIGFNINNYNDVIELKKVKIDEDLLQPFYSQYHPNEIFACDLTEQIANDNIKDEYKEFLNSLI